MTKVEHAHTRAAEWFRVDATDRPRGNVVRTSVLHFGLSIGEAETPIVRVHFAATLDGHNRAETEQRAKVQSPSSDGHLASLPAWDSGAATGRNRRRRRRSSRSPRGMRTASWYVSDPLLQKCIEMKRCETRHSPRTVARQSPLFTRGTRLCRTGARAKAWCPIYTRGSVSLLPYGAQGGNLVPPHTRGRVSHTQGPGQSRLASASSSPLVPLLSFLLPHSRHAFSALSPRVPDSARARGSLPRQRAAVRARGGGARGPLGRLSGARRAGRGLHSSTTQLNWSALYGRGGARRGCVARVEGVFRVCRGVPYDRHGSS